MEGFKNTTRTKYMTGGQVVAPSRPTPPAPARTKSGPMTGPAPKPDTRPIPSRTKSGPMPQGPAFEGKPDTRPIPSRPKSGPMTGAPTPADVTRRRPAMVDAAPTKMAKGGMMKEGVSSRPTDSSGRRMTNEELGMTPGGVDPAKKKVLPKGIGAMSNLDKERAKKKATPKVMSDLERARAMVTRPLARKEGGGVPAYNGKPMIRRKGGGLAAMPKGKC